MLEVEMFKQMLIMQNEINSLVNPNWKQANYPWHRAIWVEAAELIEHHGYKWWKKQAPDWPQITLEIVDIWHFGMSMLLMLDLTPDQLADDLTLQYDVAVNDHEYDHADFIHRVEVLAGTATTGIFDTITFFDVMLTANIDLDVLFTMYVGKNVLNKFRQVNGYKQGTYNKLWYDGREDNEHLTDIMNLSLVEANDEHMINNILQALQIAYDHPIVNDDGITYVNGC